MDKLKLIIADDEHFICAMLRKLIRFDELGLELVDFVYDGESLLKKVEEMRPDIVLTDICMPKLDGLDVIRIAKEKGLKCRFVVISGYRQFEYAYNALKYEVEDFLLKPVDTQELNAALKRICDALREDKHPVQEKGETAIRKYLVEKAVHKELAQDDMSMDEINRMFHTRFQPGLFRYVFVKLDYSRNADQILDDLSSVIEKLRKLILSSFSAICIDVLVSEKRDGIMFLLNYQLSADGPVKKEMQELFIEIKNFIELFQGIHATIGVGKAVAEVGKLDESKISCRRASWLRMDMGTNRIIFAEDVEEGQVSGYQSRFKEMEENLEKAYTGLDSAAVKKNITQIFELPPKILGSTQTMLFVRKQIERFCEIYKIIAKDTTEQEEIFDRIAIALHLRYTFASYRDELIRQMCGMLDSLAESIREKNVKPIRQACVYIERNYAQHLSLEMVAQEVNLSPAYFSNLFKKETGRNFTEYLTDCRIKAAKDMLRTGERNVNEIALALGFSDARYFSKLFKKEVGVKPTEYRKIYG